MGMLTQGAFPFSAGSRWSQNSAYYNFTDSIPGDWRGHIDAAAGQWDRNGLPPADSWMDLLPGAGPFNNGNLEVGETQFMFGCGAASYACTQPIWLGKKTVFDDDRTWTTTGASNCGVQPEVLNVKTIAVHEFGHWVELNHPSGHPEAVMSFDCTDKQTLRQDDRDGTQYLYGTELSAWDATGGLSSSLEVPSGQPNWLHVAGTANTQYWTARGKGQVVYRLGPVVNAGGNNRWRIDVDVYLNSASGTGWSPQLYLIDTSGHWVKVGWMMDVGYSNPKWFVQSSAGNLYWGTEQGNAHHFAFFYNPTTKFLSWIVDVTPMWSSFDIPFDNPYVLEQGLARAVGDKIDVTFKNFRITTDWSPN